VFSTDFLNFFSQVALICGDCVFPARQPGRVGVSSGMTIFTSKVPLIWGKLDVPMLGLEKDWYGTALQPPAGYALAMDDHKLWFIAHHRKPAYIHPQARPGRFQAELWRYDVAELFLADPVSGRYFEFNLAPNGAWWTCELTAPRVRAEEIDIAMPEVETFSDMAVDGAWLVAMSIPLDLLRARLNFGQGIRANVTMILESPEQRFISASDLGGGEPDYHLPARYPEAIFVPLPANL
jgi:hypothetical protein